MRLALVTVGKGTLAVLAFVGGLTRAHAALALGLVRLRKLSLGVIARITLDQVRFTGVEAAPLVALAALSVGAVSIMQSVNRLSSLAPDMIGLLLATVIVRELGPLATAVILIGRSGTAMATELGSMRLSGEMEALKVYRIDPAEFIMLPRVLGTMLSLFSLIVLFDLMGVLGGYGIAVLLQDMSASLVRGRVLSALTNVDLAVTALKALFFGHAIAILSCYFGLRVQRSPSELPQAVTRAAVASIIAVVLVDGLAAAFYLP